jgi:hypothetical protein
MAEMPLGVKVATAILLVLVTYCAIFSPVLLAVGLFSGLSVLVAGAIHGIVVPIAIILRWGIRRRSAGARWTGVVFAIGGAGLLAFVILASLVSGSELGAILVPITMLVLLCAMACGLMTRPADFWFNEGKSNDEWYRITGSQGGVGKADGRQSETE